MKWQVDGPAVCCWLLGRLDALRKDTHTHRASSCIIYPQYHYISARCICQPAAATNQNAHTVPFPLLLPLHTHTHICPSPKQTTSSPIYLYITPPHSPTDIPSPPTRHHYLSTTPIYTTTCYRHFCHRFPLISPFSLLSLHPSLAFPLHHPSIFLAICPNPVIPRFKFYLLCCSPLHCFIPPPLPSPPSPRLMTFYPS